MSQHTGFSILVILVLLVLAAGGCSLVEMAQAFNFW